MTVFEKAPAKINLGLRVLGKRGDGFHDILSIFQNVSVFDSLTLEPSERTILECNNPSITCGEDNLVMKAERIFRKHTGIAENTKFTLEKTIPAGAGLGGGSSDAAAALRGLCRLNGIAVGDEELQKWGSELGSDIPFMIRGGTAVVGGRGEVVEYVEWPYDFTYVIVFPGFGVSTSEAYRSFSDYPDDKGIYRKAIVHLKQNKTEKAAFLDSLVNDFERVVFPSYPVLAEIKKEFLANGASASFLTGSGSSIIGIFEDQDTATEAANTFSVKYQTFTASGL